MKTVKLAELCNIIPGRHIIEAKHNRAHKGVPYLTGPSDFGELHATATRWTERPDVMCRPLDVLVVVKGAGVANINLAPHEPSCIGRQLMAVRAKANVADAEYIYFAIASATQRLKGEAIGATVPGLSIEHLENLEVPTASIDEQRCIASRLRKLFASVQKARAAVKTQIAELQLLVNATLRESLSTGQRRMVRFSDCLIEVTAGIGKDWRSYPVFGATRAGLAPAKERPGKRPDRYKPVDAGTVFYNPMRILIGSIAFVDDDDGSGITSPDYVVLKGKPGVVDSRWFYYWLSSPLGERCIQSLVRGAVRERMLFNRLAEGEIDLPDYRIQLRTSKALAQIKPMRTAVQRQIQELDLIPPKCLSKMFGP